jgi:hypothetical protein
MKHSLSQFLTVHQCAGSYEFIAEPNTPAGKKSCAISRGFVCQRTHHPTVRNDTTAGHSLSIFSDTTRTEYWTHRVQFEPVQFGPVVNYSVKYLSVAGGICPEKNLKKNGNDRGPM